MGKVNFNGRKAQMAIFIMIAFVIFVVVAFVIAASIQNNREEYQRRADRVTDALVSSSTIRTFIDTCVAQSAQSAFKELSLHGGFFPNLTDPRTGENVNANVRFLEYERDGNLVKTAYILRKGPYESRTFYPCSLTSSYCGGLGTPRLTDGIHFCNFSLSNQDKLETCRFGDFQNLLIDLAPNSFRRQLEISVAKRISDCIDVDFFNEEMGIEINEINEVDVDVNVLVGTNSISFTANIPLIVELSRSESIRTTTSSYIINTDFRRFHDTIFFRPNSALRVEWRDIFNNFYRKAENLLVLNRLEYDIEHRPNELFRDDLFIFRHRDFMVGGEFYEFVFAIGNRKPAMSVIDYAPNNPLCEFEVPEGTNVTIDPEFADPDHYDDIQTTYGFDRDVLGWIQDGNILHKVVDSSDDGLVITVEISDGQFRNNQPVRICIDNNAIIDQEYRVELYYNYLGFNEKYVHATLGELQRITREDPIKLIQGGGVSQTGVWKIGDTNNCERTVSSSCVVFPGWTPCNQAYEIPAYSDDEDDVFDLFSDCDLAVGDVNKISFTSLSSGQTEYVDVFVDECFPHRDEDNTAGNNLYLRTNVCCNLDFTYKGFGDEDITELFCGNVSLDIISHENNTDVFSPSANDFFNVSFSSTCLENRGNIRAPNQIAIHNESPQKVVPDFPDINLVPERRRCAGCGLFGSYVNSDVIVRFDYSQRNSYRGTFESYFLKENDPNLTPYICNPNYACVKNYGDTGRGTYSEDNYVGLPSAEQAMLKCKAACNWNICDYAVDCVCTTECGESVSSSCDGKAVGELTGTCFSNEDNLPYFPEVCTTSCTSEDSKEGIFKCDGHNDPDNDCVHCDYECHGKRAYDSLETCSLAGSPGVLNVCSPQGRAIDNEFGGIRVCMFDPSINCMASQYCDSVAIGDYARLSSGEISTENAGSNLFVDVCSEDCLVVDSDICWSKPNNDVHPDCHQRTIFEGFHYAGSSSVLDGFCTDTCSRISCAPRAFSDSVDCRNNPTHDNCCVDA